MPRSSHPTACPGHVYPDVRVSFRAVVILAAILCGKLVDDPRPPSPPPPPPIHSFSVVRRRGKQRHALVDPVRRGDPQ